MCCLLQGTVPSGPHGPALVSLRALLSKSVGMDAVGVDGEIGATEEKCMLTGSLKVPQELRSGWRLAVVLNPWELMSVGHHEASGRGEHQLGVL